MTEKCKKCKKEKDVDEFRVDKNCKDGYRNECKKCYNDASRRRHIDNPIPNMYKDAKRRSKEDGIEFTITQEDIDIPLFCPYLPSIRLHVTKNKLSDNSPSLDRIDPLVGYTPANIIVCSYKANSVKRNCTPEDLKILYKNLQTIIKQRKTRK